MIKAVLKSALRGLLGFGIGSISAACGEWYFLAGGLRTGPPPYSTLVFLIAYFACGAIGAMILVGGAEQSRRSAIGFGCGFILMFFIVMFTHISLQGGGKPDYSWGAMGCGIGFALGGGLGGLSIRRGLFFPGAIAFGIGGAIWGPISFALAYSGTQPSVSIIGLLAFSLPYLIGGALFGAAVGLLGIEECW